MSILFQKKKKLIDFMVHKIKKGMIDLLKKEIFNLSNIVTIDNDKYGITEGVINHKAPYTEEEYALCKANIEGIQRALNDLSSKGYREISLSKGVYNICYLNPKGLDFNGNTGWEITIPSNIVFNLNGSTIRVIFDSDNRNPYDTSSLDTWRLNGKVFRFSKTENSSICNGEILGDRYERSFTNTSEKNIEQTYGIYITNGSNHCSLKNLKISGFMGDSVSGDANHNPDKGGVVVANPTLTAGYLSTTNGTEVTTNTFNYTFISDFLNLNNIISTGNNLMTLRTNIGYAYLLNCDNDFIMYFYDTDKNFISANRYWQLDNIVIPSNAQYCRICLICQGMAGTTSDTWTLQLTPPSSQFITVEGCTIFNNNRGGMSNLPHDIVIDNCEFYHNGTTGTENFPQFGDTTRYMINCEDTVNRKITIRNCYFHNGFNGLLLSSFNALVDNNTFDHLISSAILYSGKQMYFTNNKCRSVPMPSVLRNTTNRKIFVRGNYFYNSEIKIIEEMVLGENMFLSPKLSVTNNNIKPFVGGIMTDSPVFLKSDIGGNTINGYIKDTQFNMTLPQFSTSISMINLDDKSENVIINCSDKAKRYKILNANNLTLISGRWYIDTTSTKANVKNSTLTFGQYASVTAYSNNLTQDFSFDNVIFNTVDDYSSDNLFNFASNSSYTEGEVLKLSFKNCTFNITNDSVRKIIYARYNDAYPASSVDIIFDNCTFNNTSSNQVVIIDRYGNTFSNANIVFTNNTINGDFVTPTTP